MTRRHAHLARWLAPVAGALAALLLVPGPAHAEDASIAHVEATDDGLRVLVSVPPDAQVDLKRVTASLDGTDLDASASLAESDTVVQRTTVLAIDTSDSMAQAGRFEAAKAAAATFLDTVPADVEVGIVTFDGAVATALEPTTDRDAARAVVSGLSLSKGTLLYDGILSAVDVAGEDGQRSVLVLSDGADTGDDTTLEDVTAAVTETATLVDVVSLDQAGPDLEALAALAESGNGRVIESSGDALAEAFAAEAEVLASQVLVTAPLPAGFDETTATVSVTLPTAGGDLVASALAPIQDATSKQGSAPLAAPVSPDRGRIVPDWVLYAGLGVFGIGLLTGALLLVPRKAQPLTIADRVSAYSRSAPAEQPDGRAAAEPMLDQARAAAAGVLERNQGLEQKLANRLYAAGSGLKPSEWLLLQVGVVLAAALLGFLLSGHIVVALIFLVVGAFVPRIYLSWKAGRRRRRFNAVLPETLQMMAGSLSAGLSLAQSVDTIVREGPDPIASEFKRVLVETRIGVGLEEAFDGVAARFDSLDFAWVVMAIRIQRQVGGNLAEILNTVAATMREREYLRRQVKSLAAEGTLSAIVLCALPPGFFLFVYLTRPEYMTPMFESLIGLLILGGATLWLLVGVFWMSRLVKVEV